MYEIRIGNIGNFNGHSAQNLIGNPGGARLQGEPSGQGGYNTCEDLPRPGYYLSIFVGDCKFWLQIITLTS